MLLISIFALIDSVSAQIQLNDPLPFLGNVTEFLISPDGNTIVYRADQNTDGVFELFSVPIDGGTVTRLNSDLPTGGDVLGNEGTGLQFFQIAPNSNTVVYIAEQNANARFELFSVPITGGTPTRLNDDLATSGNVLEFIISPDGARVVYFADQNANARNELFSVPISGGAVVRLNDDLPSGGDVFFSSNQIQISSDGNTVVYIADQNTDAVIELFSVPIVGGTPIRLNGNLITGGDVAGDFVISPDGTTIIYGADQIADGFGEIFAVPIVGGTPIRLNGNLPIANGGGDVENFSVSADGNTVVYTADQITTGLVELFAVAIGGGVPLRLNPNLGGTTRDVFDFIISSDSVNVVYRAEQNISGVIELFSVPIIGGAAIQLNIPLSGIKDVRNDYQISLDGQTVIHRSDPDSFNVEEVFSTPILGGTPIQLNAQFSDIDVTDFIISDDSTTVLFHADQDTNNIFELYGISISGNNLTRLNGDLVAGGQVENDFKINSDGTRVVYRADQDVDEEIELFSNIVDISLGINDNDLSQNTIRLFPNPAKNVFLVDYSSLNSIRTIALYNIQGILVKQIDVENTENPLSIPIHHLASGVYLVQIEEAKNLITKKLIIQ